MAGQKSKKNSWLRFIISFLPAAVLAVVLCILLPGLQIGPIYDFLLKKRPPVPVSHEILLIDSSLERGSEDILEPGAASSLLYTMAELGAKTLIIQVPILGLSAGGKAGEAEILYRFDEEFSLLSRNIRNLFDAIRTGSIAPGESAKYVGELVALSDKGKERLVSALVRRDEEGIDKMEKAALFFGHATQPGDLMVQLIMAGESGGQSLLAKKNEYSRAIPDKDGILRRISPILAVTTLDEKAGKSSLKHIIYSTLKTRYEKTGIEYIDSAGIKPRQILTLRGGPEGINMTIPLDYSGAILFEKPHKETDFRRISISEFLAYEEADRELRQLLAEGEGLGIFQYIEGENNPLILYDYALSLRDEGNKQSWIEVRKKYFESLENFLYGSTEMKLVGGYEEIIASEPGIVKLADMRDSMIRSFISLRKKHAEVTELREKLENALAFSFCILGRTSDPLAGPETEQTPTDTEASALLANSLLTGSTVKPGEDMYLLLGSMLLALLACFFIKGLGPAPAIGIGSILCIAAGAIFSWYFIFYGIWLNPLVPVLTCIAGVISSFIYSIVAKARHRKHFRLAFGPYVSRACLRSVSLAGKPLPSQIIKTRAAVVVIKNPDPQPRINSSFTDILDFQENAASLLKKAGGTIIGAEGNTITGCFGSPLERIYFRSRKKLSPYDNKTRAEAAPAMQAIDFILSIVQSPEYKHWHFGLDIGNCTFGWTEIEGYFAMGNPVQQAKILSRLAFHYKTRILISSALNETMTDLHAEKMDINTEKEELNGEAVYRLLGINGD